MDTAMTLNWLEMRRMTNARVRQDDQARILTLTRENPLSACLHRKRSLQKSSARQYRFRQTR